MTHPHKRTARPGERAAANNNRPEDALFATDQIPVQAALTIAALRNGDA
jgi:hypothetical protein